MANKKHLYSNVTLTQLVNQEHSCVSLVKRERKVALHPAYLSDLKGGVSDVLCKSLKKYDPSLNGILMGYQNVEIDIGKKNTGKISGRGELDLNITAEYFIFQPKIGSNLKGIVNKKSSNHIGCLVHNYFNATILKPEDVKYDDWCCKNIELEDKIVFRVIELDFSGPLPYIEGTMEDSGKTKSRKKHKEKSNKAEESFLEFELQPEVNNMDNSEENVDEFPMASDHKKQRKKDKKEKKEKKEKKLKFQVSPEQNYHLFSSTQLPSFHKSDADLDFDLLSPVTKEDKETILTLKKEKKKKRKESTKEDKTTEFIEEPKRLLDFSPKQGDKPPPVTENTLKPVELDNKDKNRSNLDKKAVVHMEENENEAYASPKPKRQDVSENITDTDKDFFKTPGSISLKKKKKKRSRDKDSVSDLISEVNKESEKSESESEPSTEKRKHKSRKLVQAEESLDKNKNMLQFSDNEQSTDSPKKKKSSKKDKNSSDDVVLKTRNETSDLDKKAKPSLKDLLNDFTSEILGELGASKILQEPLKNKQKTSKKEKDHDESTKSSDIGTQNQNQKSENTESTSLSMLTPLKGSKEKDERLDNVPVHLTDHLKSHPGDVTDSPLGSSSRKRKKERDRDKSQDNTKISQVVVNELRNEPELGTTKLSKIEDTKTVVQSEVEGGIIHHESPIRSSGTTLKPNRKLQTPELQKLHSSESSKKGSESSQLPDRHDHRESSEKKKKKKKKKKKEKEKEKEDNKALKKEVERLKAELDAQKKLIFERGLADPKTHFIEDLTKILDEGSASRSEEKRNIQIVEESDEEEIIIPATQLPANKTSLSLQEILNKKSSQMKSPPLTNIQPLTSDSPHKKKTPQKIPPETDGQLKTSKSPAKKTPQKTALLADRQSKKSDSPRTKKTSHSAAATAEKSMFSDSDASVKSTPVKQLDKSHKMKDETSSDPGNSQVALIASLLQDTKKALFSSSNSQEADKKSQTGRSQKRKLLEDKAQNSFEVANKKAKHESSITGESTKGMTKNHVLNSLLPEFQKLEKHIESHKESHERKKHKKSKSLEKREPSNSDSDSNFKSIYKKDKKIVSPGSVVANVKSLSRKKSQKKLNTIKEK